MACFGPCQDTKSPGSHKGERALYCENPRCQDIFLARRWGEKNTPTGRLATVLPPRMFTINEHPVWTSQAWVTHKTENIVSRHSGSAHSYGYKITETRVTSHAFPRATEISFCYNSHTASWLAASHTFTATPARHCLKLMMTAARVSKGAGRRGKCS